MGLGPAMNSRLYSLVEFIAGLCMASMMAVTIVDAIGRYVFDAPFPGAIEYVSYLLGLLVFAGYVLVTRDRTHIVVGMIAELLPRGYQRIEAIVSTAVTFAGCCLVVWLTIDQARRYGRSGIAGETSHIPVGALVWVFVIFAIIAAIAAFQNLRRRLSSNRFQEDGNHGP